MKHSEFINKPLKNLIDEICATGEYAINFYCVDNYGDLKDLINNEEVINKNISFISDHMGDYSIWISLYE